MILCVFGEHTVSDETLLQSFFNYIPLDERQIVKESLVKENISADGDDSELLDVLSNYSTRRIRCTGAQLKKLLHERDNTNTQLHTRVVGVYIFVH